MGHNRRGPWVQEEDNTLLCLVRSQGPNNWVRISQHMGTRSPKQCRERYHQNLKPSLNHEPITQEEGVRIEQLVKEMGKRWAEIARRLGHRSDNAVKNWWNGSMNRRRRIQMHQTDNSSRPRYTGPQEPLPVSRQALPVTSLNISATQRMQIEGPLVSPSVSEACSHDSIMEGAPSLVADTGSNTTSPNAHSPSFSFNLPPLVIDQRRVEERRRSSLPDIPCYTYDESQTMPTFSPASGQDVKTPGGGFVRPELATRFIKHQSSASLPPLHAVVQENESPQQWLRPQQLPNSPPQVSAQTPVMQQYSQPLTNLVHSPSRDNRMNLSSLIS